MDEHLLDQLAEGILVRWDYVYGEFQEGLLDEENVPVELWRRTYSDTPRFAKFWQERGNYSFRPDFVQYMEENVLNER